MKPVSDLPFVGGHIALDFVNTADGRGDPLAGEALLTPGDLHAWGRRYRLLASSTPPLGADAVKELERARAARELLYALLHDRAHGAPPSPRGVADLAALAREAYDAGSLESRSDRSVGWRWSDAELATVRHVAVTSAIELLEDEPNPRLKQCPGESCGWLFIDRSKRGNRRWCSMRECGQEAKDEQRRAARARAR
jgi:predicted RNA-binding Zn ribbon-like protein